MTSESQLGVKQLPGWPSLSVQRDSDFLLIEGESGVQPKSEQWIPMTLRSAGLPAGVKLARYHRDSCLQLRAEIPVPEDATGEWFVWQANKVHNTLRGLPEWLSAAGKKKTKAHEALDETAEEAISESVVDLVKEAGWECHRRSGGEVLVDMDAGNQFLQAGLRCFGEITRLRVTMATGSEVSEAALVDLCIYLSEANSALRLARGYLVRNGFVSTGFEVCLDGTPGVTQVGHALSALSIAGRTCAREMQLMLHDASIANLYGCARGVKIMHEEQEN